MKNAHSCLEQSCRSELRSLKPNLKIKLEATEYSASMGMIFITRTLRDVSAQAQLYNGWDKRYRKMDLHSYKLTANYLQKSSSLLAHPSIQC